MMTMDKLLRWAAALVLAQCASGKWTLEHLSGLDGLLDEQVAQEHFEAWRGEFGKEYAHEAEARYRQAIWRTSFDMVREHNARGLTYKLEVNEFADMTPEEFNAQFLMQAPQPGCSATLDGWSAGPEALAGQEMPTKVDWREKNILSPVKYQGKCGSCWTFSTTGAVESHLALYKDQRLLLSEQQLVDCAGDFDNHGCNGGLPSHAFEYIKYNGGLETEEEYPYKAKNGKCKFDASAPVKGMVKDSVNITAFDEHSLEVAVATKGPVSIAYHVAPDFRLYHSGVYYSAKCPDQPGDVNHAVLAVGFDAMEVDGKSMPFFIVKNSWGAKWGMKGYFNIARGYNMCGLSDCASWPLV